MHNRIIIIHHLDIIRKGIETIIKEAFQYPVNVLSDFNAKAIKPKSGDKLLFITDEINAKKIQASLGLFNHKTELLICFDQPKNHESLHKISLNISREQLCKQVEQTFSGHGESPPHAAHKNELSRRESEILALVANGLSNKEIAGKLFISPHTVISHRKNITEKLGIKTISGLTVYAVINGIIDIGQISRDDLI
ncbi:MAG: LuxR C-terminal-related transcriptional regulator [Bacteroidota bacterium]|nr:LuxR C-terminal-related transcriptional regulator [Bacteroidota bacterium]